MNIAIVEDSTPDRALLMEAIKKCSKDNSILVNITEFGSGESFLKCAQLSSLDVVFLDIYMDKLSGMDVAIRMREMNISCQIVFVTSSTDFAVQSYTVRAFYYILKPFSSQDIEKVVKMLDQNLKKSSRFIRVKEGREWRKIMLAEILYADYGNHYTQLHTETGTISTYAKFQEISEKLLESNEFLICYRCIVVNMNKIKKIDDLFFLLYNGEYLPINRKNVKEIKAHYTDYIFETLQDKISPDD